MLSDPLGGRDEDTEPGTIDEVCLAEVEEKCARPMIKLIKHKLLQLVTIGDT